MGLSKDFTTYERSNLIPKLFTYYRKGVFNESKYVKDPEELLLCSK
jgi:hypothetical protein